MGPGTRQHTLQAKGSGYYLFVSQLELLSCPQRQQYFFVALKNKCFFRFSLSFCPFKKDSVSKYDQYYPCCHICFSYNLTRQNSKDPNTKYKNKIESATNPTTLDAKSAFIFPLALSGEQTAKSANSERRKALPLATAILPPSSRE